MTTHALNPARGAIDAALAATLRAAHEREEAAARAAEQAVERTGDLSPRELEVLRLTADGHQDRHVAARLGISPDTVKAHQKNLRRKLAARDRAHAVHLAHGRGLL